MSFIFCVLWIIFMCMYVNLKNENKTLKEKVSLQNVPEIIKIKEAQNKREQEEHDVKIKEITLKLIKSFKEEKCKLRVDRTLFGKLIRGLSGSYVTLQLKDLTSLELETPSGMTASISCTFIS